MSDLKLEGEKLGAKIAKGKEFAWVDSIHVLEDWPALADHIRVDRQRASRNNLRLGIAMCCGLALLSTCAVFFGDVFLLFAAFAALPCVLLFEKLRRTTVARDHWIVEQPDKGEFLVEVFIEVDGVVMGSDRGILWFDEEALRFTGQRTWFRLGLRHIHHRRVRDNLVRPYDELSPEHTTVRVAYQSARVRIKIVEVPVPGRIPTRQLEDRIMYLNPLGLSSTEPTTLPPLTLDPEYRHDPFRNTEMDPSNYWSFILAVTVVALVPTTMLDDVLLFACAAAHMMYMPIGRLIRPAAIRARLRRKLVNSEQSGKGDGVLE